MERHPLRILIADDHPLFREALKQMLGGQPDFEIVAEAADGIEALELCRRHRPELVLMDVQMPKMDGIEATRAIKRELPLTIVLMLTAHPSLDYLLEALRAGAGGYVLKYVDAQQLGEAIRQALSGESPLDPKLTKQLLMHFVEETREQRPTDPSLPDSLQQGQAPPPLLEALTPREVEVVRLLVQGHTNQEIARSLLISVSAVKQHMRKIIRRLGVSDRTQAAVKAIEMGLRVEPERE